MRKLASVQQVRSIESIPDADRIEIAHVLGWQCVVKKGEFKPGDIAIYFEIDSYLPIRPEFEFLRDSSYKKSDLQGEGFRLRTQKFRGQISQGLLLPIETFPALTKDLKIDDDVTELLGVQKYEILERGTDGGTIIGALPGSIPFTDETRIQANPDLLQEFSGLEYYISTKMDGSSHSISVDQNGFHVTGHVYEYADDGKSGFYNLINDRGYRASVEAFAASEHLTSLTIQGEYCGPKVQRNRLKLKAPEWYVFTIMENDRRVGLRRMQDICAQLGLTMVPIEEIDQDLPSKYPTVDALLERATGSYLNGGPKEGIVIRPTTPVFSSLVYGDLSMKIVSNKYLLKNGD